MLYHRIVTSTKENAPWVTFIHGIGAGSIVWMKQRHLLRSHFNLLFIDLPGHGKTTYGLKDIESPDFYKIAEQIDEVLIYNQIEQSVFISLSLGTIVAQTFEMIKPNKVSSMVLCGAVESFNLVAQIGIRLLPLIKRVIPYMTFYKFAVHLLLPGKKYKESRDVFVQQAVHLGTDEFYAWGNMRLSALDMFKKFRQFSIIDKLYIMGGDDRMFIGTIKKKAREQDNITLAILPHTGHVCNIERPNEFNQILLDYLT